MSYILTPTQVGKRLANLGNYRVIQAQVVAAEGPSDGISGALLLSLGLRESQLQNINNAAETDHGCFQISELYHLPWLQSQVGCREGQWVADAAHRADETGFCPRYTPALSYALDMVQKMSVYGRKRYGLLTAEDAVRFGVAAYNAGLGGAVKGLGAGDVDKFTTGGDYSSWVMATRLDVQHWLDQHPNWQPHLSLP